MRSPTNRKGIDTTQVTLLKRKERMKVTDNELLVKVEASEKFSALKAYPELIDLT